MSPRAVPPPGPDGPGRARGAARRRLLLAGLSLLAAPAVARAQDSGGDQPGTPVTAGRLWFDPTQLPSFTGVIERYLINPEGKSDRLLFREGPQVIFPEHVGAELSAALPTGSTIVVYGIRARRAPAITMLAWAKDGDPNNARFIDRPGWSFPAFRAADQRMTVEGEVRMPLYTPQGDSIGAVLNDGTVVRVPIGVANALGDRLNAGKRLAAEGQGAANETGRALDAARIGEEKDKLEPLPAPVERPQ